MITGIVLYCVVKVGYKISLNLKLARNQRFHITGSFIQMIKISHTTVRII